MSHPSPAPEMVATSFGEFVHAHTYCDCSPTMTYCGLEFTNGFCDAEPGDVPCLICEDEALAPCPRCGEL